MPLKTERIEFSDWLTLHLKTWEQHRRFRDIKLEPDDVGDCFVTIQPVLAGELVNILLDNACKYSPLGTPIRMRVKREADVVRLFVEDQGIGISDRDQDQIFAPFFRAAQASDRVVEGVGIGLSIARRLAASFGGSLSVSSRLGVGSCFTLSLPAATASPTEMTAAANCI